MIPQQVRVRTAEELNAWLRNNISTGQAKPGWILATCPDRAVHDLSIVSELKAKGWKLIIREWDYDSEDDPRAMCYWLVCTMINVLGLLELLEENEAFAKEEGFQSALKLVKHCVPMAQQLQRNLAAP